MDVKDSRVNHSQNQFLGTYQKLVLNKTCRLKLLEQILQAQIMAKNKSKRVLKVYILLFTCRVSRAIHLEILTNQTTEEFIEALKRLIARRGRP